MQPADAGAAGPSLGQDDRSTAEIVRELRAIREELAAARGCQLGQCAEVGVIREQQRAFLKTHQKFPDFLDVGLAVWQRVYDWHITHSSR